MIHYHGLPITPSAAAVAAVEHGHAFVSHASPAQLGIAVEVCSSFALDNGAFSAWRAGCPVEKWDAYYAWAGECSGLPSCDWAVIPDVIDGSEKDNDLLISEWPHGRFGVPVWHLHESLDRLDRLVYEWPRVCLGSSGEFSMPGSARWWCRMSEAMAVACIDGAPRAKLHGLRMLNPDVFSHLPLASADSTNIGRNIGIDSAWRGTYAPPNKATRAAVMRSRIESHQAPARWIGAPVGHTPQLEMKL